jgi:hypothetical protein
LLVEQTSFISCKTTSSYGGGIYFYSTTNGECILSKICGFDCSSKYSSGGEGQFTYIYTRNSPTFKNHLNDSSITHSLNGYTGTLSAIFLWYGNILCPSVNSTNNVCYYYTALRTVPTPGTGSPTSETCCISYSSIVNNTASGHICIMIDRTSTSQRIDTCNIINNKQSTSSFAIIYSNGNLLIKDSCIIGNDENNKIFYVSSCRITLSNCTIDDGVFTNGRYSGDVTVIKTITKPFINALSHISTYHCDSYYDSYGTLTGKPNVPSKTSRCFMSCDSKYQTNDLLSYMKFMFLLTFLPSDLLNDFSF